MFVLSPFHGVFYSTFMANKRTSESLSSVIDGVYRTPQRSELSSVTILLLVSKQNVNLYGALSNGLGLDLVKSGKVSVSVSSRTESQTSRSRLGLGPQRLVYIPANDI